MEQFNFNGAQNILKSICWILSYLFWLLFVINNLASLKWMYKEGNIWCIQFANGFELQDVPIQLGDLEDLEDYIEYNGGLALIYYGYIPIQMDNFVIFMVFNITIIISFVACIIYFIKTLYKKEQSIINGMMGKFSQFHFIPFLFAFILSVLGEIKKEENTEDAIYTGLPFSLLGIASMIFIYINTEIKSQDWWAEYSLKGTFSCMTILLWYNFWLDIFWVGIENKKALVSAGFFGGCGMAFSIIFGIGSLIFSFVTKDIIICFMNILMHIGMAKYYFEKVDCRNHKYCNKNGDGAIDLIILICSIFLFLYQLVEKINEILTAKVNEKTAAIVKVESDKLKALILTIGQAQNQVISKVNSNSEQINLLSSNINLTSKA